MAMLDAKTLLAEDKALPASATTEYSTNEIDFGAGMDAFGAALADPNIGKGTPLFLNLVMNTAAASAGGGTAAFNIVHGAATAPTTKLLEMATALNAAALPAGKKLSVALPSDPRVLKVMRLQVVTTTAGFESGTYTAWVDIHPLADV